ncbi:MAG: DUF4404 family protein [Planctomycetia bacterium]|nr:DUF4404 family protein [Planctomycetia bacterium]
MSNETETLHDRVDACRRHLTTAELNADVRGELLQLLADLDERLANQASSSKSTTAKFRTEQQTLPSPIERLRDLERSVEATHPVLCGLVGNLADSLSRLGI